MARNAAMDVLLPLAYKPLSPSGKAVDVCSWNAQLERMIRTVQEGGERGLSLEAKAWVEELHELRGARGAEAASRTAKLIYDLKCASHRSISRSILVPDSRSQRAACSDEALASFKRRRITFQYRVEEEVRGYTRTSFATFLFLKYGLGISQLVFGRPLGRGLAGRIMEDNSCVDMTTLGARARPRDDTETRERPRKWRRLQPAGATASSSAGDAGGGGQDDGEADFMRNSLAAIESAAASGSSGSSGDASGGHADGEAEFMRNALAAVETMKAEEAARGAQGVVRLRRAPGEVEEVEEVEESEESEWDAERAEFERGDDIGQDEEEHGDDASNMVGATVTIVGLTRRVDLNGSGGTVISCNGSDPESRCSVEMHPTHNIYSVMWMNLRIIGPTAAQQVATQIAKDAELAESLERPVPITPSVSSTRCPVCLETYNAVNVRRCIRRSCGHALCDTCASRLETKRCPACRKPPWARVNRSFIPDYDCTAPQ